MYLCRPITVCRQFSYPPPPFLVVMYCVDEEELTNNIGRLVTGAVYCLKLKAVVHKQYWKHIYCDCQIPTYHLFTETAHLRAA